MAVLPFAGWSSQTIKQFAVFWGKVAYPFGREGQKFDSHTGLLAAALVSALGFTLYSFLGGDAEVRFLRFWDRYVNKKNTQLKTFGEATDTTEAFEIGLHNVTAVMPLMNSALNNLLGATGYRGQYGFQAFAFDKVNAMLNYARGIVRTHDITYGIDRLVEAQIPFTESIIENVFNREGFQTSRNSVRALQKFGPQDLVERRASASVSLPTELTPYRMELQEAVFSGRPQNVEKAAAAFVEKARELGRTDPEKSLSQTFSTLNPYRQAFGGLITDEQRQAALKAMSPWERQEVAKAERNYSAAADQLGFSANMAKGETAGAGGYSGGAGGGVGTSGGGMGSLPGLTSRRVSLGTGRLGAARGLGGAGRLGTGRSLGNGLRSRTRLGAKKLVSGRLSLRSGRVRRLAGVGPRKRRVSLA